ncbi:hypothetical protein ACFCW2_04640 [Qipengyuania sp. DSG2-2]|uniref:hypothetical protein n=1 Tax=Qipengyuania sp. DGS2-2 TaxID=3349631 RepID=UPI0036D3E7F7
MQARATISGRLVVGLGCASLAMAGVPAHADTRVSVLLPLSQQTSAVATCAASRSAAEVATAAQGAQTAQTAQAAQTRGCLLPLRAAPPPAVQPPPPAPPAPPVAAPAAGGGFGWLAPALAGIAAIVGIVVAAGGGDNGANPGISPG